MRITRLAIKNFRCIKSLDIGLSPTSVLIGENNAGKTAVLDAVKIALSRHWGRSGQTGFSEYDFPLNTAAGEDCSTIEITMLFSEQHDEPRWPDELLDDLNDIIRTDVNNGLNSICMRVLCTLESVTKSVDPIWQFLREDAEPFSGAGARNQNLSRFFEYIPSFSMAAMRDASVEFGGRSRFWGQLLKTINIDPDTTADLEAKFSDLNNQLLGADPKLESIKSVLKSISTVIAHGAAGNVDVRAIPVNLWEIISKAEVVVQGHADDPWLPIAKHGHGVQSLAIIFLFRAFVENALAAAFTAETKPVLTLEEPEAHLHPQACRSLWGSINSLPGQKLVTTHSPYFVQNVPFKDIIILRRNRGGPCVVSIPKFFTAELPGNPALASVIVKSDGELTWDASASLLMSYTTLTEKRYRELLACYTGSDRSAHHTELKSLKNKSRRLMTSEDITKLESWAKRIRGEIFFSSKWLLCEGQAEYAILGAIADVLECPLDAHGISVIDYQNNGNPGAFAALARVLEYPWAMICDGDKGGDDHIAQLRTHHFSEEEIQSLVTQLPAGVDLERLLLGSALRPCVVAAIAELDASITDNDSALLAYAQGHKEEVAVRVGGHIRSTAAKVHIPEPFMKIFQKIGACE